MQANSLKIQNNIPKCNICYEVFNHNERLPLMICRQNHLMCKYCLEHIQSQLPICPFCQQPIQQSNIAVSSYILQLLPTKQSYPNTRTQINYQLFPQNHILNNSSNPIHLYQPLGQLQNDIIMQDHKISPFIHQRSSDTNCCEQLNDTLQLSNQVCRKIIYFAIIIFQMPFIVLDLYFSFTSKDSICMDTPHQDSNYILRTWFMRMGFFSASLAIILMIGIILKICKIISLIILNVIQYILIALFAIKFMVWAVIEIYLYQKTIDPFCSGSIHSYGLLQQIIYGFALFILAIMSKIN